MQMIQLPSKDNKLSRRARLPPLPETTKNGPVDVDQPRSPRAARSPRRGRSPTRVSLPREGASLSDHSNLVTLEFSPSRSSHDSQISPRSINRRFSATHVRDPRFPSPPRHHSPDAIPRPRIPPLDPKIPFVRPAVLDAYSDIYSPRRTSAHLINPMSSFVSDLTLALEALEHRLPPGEREVYGFQHSTPEFGNQTDASGLYRPRITAVPSSSLVSTGTEEEEGDAEQHEKQSEMQAADSEGGAESSVPAGNGVDEVAKVIA